MQKIGDKITYVKHKDYHTVVISPTIEKWEMGSLFVWLLAWTACGFGFVYYMVFGGLETKEIGILLMTMVFWIYFEIRITRAFLWRKFGLEIISINKERITIKDSILSIGQAKAYDLAFIDKETVIDTHVDPQSFGKVMNDSFWQVGHGTVVFDYQDKEVFFGTQLENSDSAALAKLMRKLIVKYKKEVELPDGERD